MADQQSRIIHSVIFTLKHPRESAEAEQFLADGRRILSSIPSVEQFVVNLQVSPKNDYQYGFSMAFADQEAYEAYNNHPQHTAFVAERWETEVVRFLEIDYVQWG
ncbi:stress responsive alpha/beta barrel protein [Paenibacillus cellulosilyticus]|uniref:Stress responsive alpha/beta barrel protein n=1 Tax=Paenibacillus cellulosilyticus TaxID=375489 RepID=A0A2V2YWA9_9BACL|nr:Dabb family protein [Paenibacillus cellulosilyticus]PWW05251.1 stress responsive alpha/beta barrel protein [Paenibacillus cellulosilyticus]QKS43575.1 Dabb family protein [Paenibacillus cellulosilyticus]